MLADLKLRLVTGWNFMRIIRAALAVFILTVSFIRADTLLMLGGIFLVGQTALNVGCASGNCAVNPEEKKGR